MMAEHGMLTTGGIDPAMAGMSHGDTAMTHDANPVLVAPGQTVELTWRVTEPAELASASNLPGRGGHERCDRVRGRVVGVAGYFSRRTTLQLTAAAGMAGMGAHWPGRPAFASAKRSDELAIERGRITIDGESSDAISMGGSVSAPTLHWREGEEVVIHATNRLDEPTSIHWHAMLLPGEMDGALVIDPIGREPIRYDGDYVVLMSGHMSKSPHRVLNKLKIDAGYYNQGRRTLLDFFRDARQEGIGSALADRIAWGEMRMDPTDLADVTGYAFLVNGAGPEDNWTGLFESGARIRLRFVNASAMSIFDVRIPGLPMTVVAADGNLAIQEVDERGVGAGLNDIELGMRLRYETWRQLAPYVGVHWERKIGATAVLTRQAGDGVDTVQFVSGLRFWC